MTKYIVGFSVNRMGIIGRILSIFTKYTRVIDVNLHDPELESKIMAEVEKIEEEWGINNGK